VDEPGTTIHCYCNWHDRCILLMCAPDMQKKAGCVQLSLPDPPAGWTLLSLDLRVRT
jgi:hypothetical protein